MNSTIAANRLDNQRLRRGTSRRPEEVVAWLGAVQAQEYPAARWGLGQRMGPGARDEAIRRAVDAGRILRTHLMRPTWHFVARDDIRWMLELTGPRVQRVMSHYVRRLELDALLTRAAAIFERALGDGPHLTRADLGVRLARRGVDAKGMRLGMLTMHAELEGLICSGAYNGKQLTYALVAERAPRAKTLTRDEALARLTRRFFASHGPATVRDFTWWSGLTVADGKRGLEMNRARSEAVDGLTYWSIGSGPARHAEAAKRRWTKRGVVHLLPIYDEYLIAYRDREAVPHSVALDATGPGRALPFQHPVIIDGQLAGMWRPVQRADGVEVQLIARTLTKAERAALAEAAARYARFLGTSVTLKIQQ